MAARIITFSTVNSTLGTSYTPNNYCASKKHAIDGHGKDIYPSGWEDNRLITKVEIGIQYTIRFLDWDGTVLKTQTLAPDQLIVPPPDPTRSGYTFDGWNPTLPADMLPTASVDYRAEYSIIAPPHKGDPT